MPPVSPVTPAAPVTNTRARLAYIGDVQPAGWHLEVTHMQRWTGALIVALALVVPSAFADEQPKSEEKAARPQTERKQIRVLQDPKDISSFYRSEGSSPARSAGPYGLASYYRSSAQNPRYGGYLWRGTPYEASLYYGTRGAYRRR